MATKAAIWARVSTERQSEENQIPAMERFCEHHGYSIEKRYLMSDVSAFTGAHREALRTVLDDAYRGEFEVLVVWAIDRLCREGIRELLNLIKDLRERRCLLVSVQEPWLNGSDATTELLIAIAAWVAHQESVRRGERIKLGLEKRRRDGKPMGGAASKRGKDRQPRKTEGYVQAWARRKVIEQTTS